MHHHIETWGHVGINDAFTVLYPMVDAWEEEQEMMMMRCRYGKKPFARSFTMLCGLVPQTHVLIRNPGTFKNLADIFQLNPQQTRVLLAP